jgi:hypothetical protein
MNRHFNGRRGDDSSTAMTDIMFNLLAVLILVLALVLVFINDPSLENPDVQTFEAIVEWHGRSKVDIDTYPWCINPYTGLSEVVSFQNKKGKYFNLDRDDLGYKDDKPEEDINKEIVNALGVILPEATCGVNIQVYGTNGGSLPIEGGVIVTVILNKGIQSKQLVLLSQKKFELTEPKEEITIVSFDVDASGGFVVGSDKIIQEMLCATFASAGECVPK